MLLNNILTQVTLVAIAVSAHAVPVANEPRAAQSCKALNYLVPFDSDLTAGALADPSILALQYALGPRFVNAFKPNSSEYGDVANPESWLCAITCLGTVIKIAPCVAAAIATDNPLAILACGITKEKICQCISCLPDSIENFFSGFCNSDSDITDPDFKKIAQHSLNDLYSYIDFSRESIQLRAYRGDLTNNDVTNGAKTGFCTGVSVGGNCNCCLGLYLEDGTGTPKDRCLGACYDPNH